MQTTLNSAPDNSSVLNQQTDIIFIFMFIKSVSKLYYLWKVISPGDVLGIKSWFHPFSLSTLLKLQAGDFTSSNSVNISFSWTSSGVCSFKLQMFWRQPSVDFYCSSWRKAMLNNTFGNNWIQTKMKHIST